MDEIVLTDFAVNHFGDVEMLLGILHNFTQKLVKIFCCNLHIPYSKFNNKYSASIDKLFYELQTFVYHISYG